MNRMFFVGLALGVFATVKVGSAGAEDKITPGHGRPSIVFLYTDDQAQWPLGCTATGRSARPTWIAWLARAYFFATPSRSRPSVRHPGPA